MGGRGSYSAGGGIGGKAAAGGAGEDYSRGAGIAAELGVSEREGAEMYDAINRWADGSTGIKNAQRGTGSYTEQNARDAETLNRFIDKSPDYHGDLVRCIGVPWGTKFRKNGKISSDGSITSWTVPSNVESAKTFVSESQHLVVLHVSATKGADTRRYSGLSGHDHEIIQRGGYDGSLKIDRVVVKNEYRPGSYEKEKVTHLYVRE